MPPVKPILVHLEATVTAVGYDTISFVAESQDDMPAGGWYLYTMTTGYLHALPIE